MASDFARRTRKARWQWSNAFKILKKNDFQPRILYPAQQSSERDNNNISRYAKFKNVTMFPFLSNSIEHVFYLRGE